MTVSSVEPRPLVNGTRLAGDTAHSTPLDILPSLLSTTPYSHASLRRFQQLSENSLAGKMVVGGGVEVTNQDFSRKALGLRQDAAGLLGEQALDFQDPGKSSSVAVL